MKNRIANRKDCPQLAVLNQAVQAPHAEAEPLLFKSELDTARVIEFFEEMLADPDSRILILEDEGLGVGYLYLQIMRRPENAFMYAYSVIYIHHIAVAPEKQGLGYGTKLMEGAFEIAQKENIHRVALDTWSFNTAAHKFFSNRGFTTFNLRMDKLLSDLTA